MLSLALLQSLQGDLNELTRGIQYLCLIRRIVTGEFRQLRDVPIAVGRPFAGGVIKNGAVIVSNNLQIVQGSFARVVVHGLEGCGRGRKGFSEAEILARPPIR
ncbi:hypothetical protein [truncated ORF], partial [Penicillium rubens Wisconsin 54-1255]